MNDSVPSQTEAPAAVKDLKPSIGAAVDRLVTRLRDVDECARTLVPVAIKRRRKELDTWKAQLREGASKIESIADSATVTEAKALFGPIIKELIDAEKRLVRYRHSDPIGTLRRSLLIGAFSLYDAFFGECIEAIYASRPELLNSFGGSVPIADVLSAHSMDDFRTSLITREVEQLRRESYVEQFEQLERRFSIPLRKFPAWPVFVESGQRRNLLTHCDGRVSTQYLEVCRSQCVPLPKELSPGDKLVVDKDYLSRACRVIMEVGVKLAHTLWRKALPDELGTADDHLNRVVYEALNLEDWDWAITIGDFALGQHKTFSDIERRIQVVNLAIARKFNGEYDKCKKLLDERDWSSIAPDFTLACLILHDDFAGAAQTMRLIGKEGRLIDEQSYHLWPLFKEFRGSQEFLHAFEDIYGHPFIRDFRAMAPAAHSRPAILEETAANAEKDKS